MNKIDRKEETPKREEILSSEIHSKLKRILGPLEFKEDHTEISATYKKLEYELDQSKVDELWKNRPVIIPYNRPLPYELNISPSLLKKNAKLVVSRDRFKETRFGDANILGYEIQLRVVPVGEISKNLEWIYQLQISQAKENKPYAEVSFYKDWPDDSSPIFGEILDKKPSEEQLEVFNKFLNHALQIEPVKSNLIKQKLTL